MPIQLLSEDRNPDSNCLLIFEGKIPKNPSGITPMLARTSGSELLLIITDKNIQKITGIISSMIKWSSITRTDLNFMWQIQFLPNKHHNPETGKIEHYLITILEQEWKASAES